jgi:hypothetical protein
MSYIGPVPEEGLVPMAQVVVAKVIPSARQVKQQTDAVEWISDLCRTVRSWHEQFLKLMRDHPGFRNSTVSAEYRAYFRTLARYRHDLDLRTGYVKDALCNPIDLLRERFDRDFEWLRVQDPAAHTQLRAFLDDAYRSEVGVIEIAQRLIASVMEWETYVVDYESLLTTPGFIRWQVAHSKDKVDLINRYSERSAEEVLKLREVAKGAQAGFLKSGDKFNLDRLALVGDGGIASSKLQDLRKELAMELNSTPQADNRLLYTLMAFCFGVVSVGIIMLMAWYNPNPTPYQTRVFNTVLAVALGGVATVMSGLLKADLRLGNQLVVGATGAFAVFVLTYFFAPA